jgi:hypothetical protein
MSQALELTPTEIRRTGWEALRKSLGIAGALRFILQYEKGEGDYTKVRRELFRDATVEELISEIDSKK